MEDNTIGERIERLFLGCAFQLGMCLPPILSAAAAVTVKTFSSPLFKSSFTTATIHYLGFVSPLQNLILVLSLCISIISVILYALFVPFYKSKNALLLEDATIHLIRRSDGYEICSKDIMKASPCNDEAGSGLLLHLTAIGGTSMPHCNLWVYCTIGITLVAFWMMLDMNGVLHYVFLLSMIGFIMSYARTIFINTSSSLSRKDIAWFISIDNNLSPAPMDNKIDGHEQQGDVDLATSSKMVELKGRIWKLFVGCSLQSGMCVQAIVNSVHLYSSSLINSATITSILTVLVGLAICFTFISFLFYLHKEMKAIVVKLESPAVDYEFCWNKATFGRDLLRVFKVVLLWDCMEMRAKMWPLEWLISWAFVISFCGIMWWNPSYDLYYYLVGNSMTTLSVYCRWVYHSFTKFDLINPVHNKSASSDQNGSISDLEQEDSNVHRIEPYISSLT